MVVFSILMNCYNCEKYLKEAIDSVFAQTFTDWEIIFIDNSSTDSSAEIAKSYGEKIKYHKTHKLLPLGEARNHGLHLCEGEFLAFLDTDDLWYPEKLETQERVMRFGDYQMCYTGATLINKESKTIGKEIPVAKSGYVFPQQLLRYEINMQSVVIRNDIQILFDDKKEFSPDFDLFLKIASKHKVAVIPDELVKYRKLSDSLTSKKIDRWWIETRETLDDIFRENPKFAEQYPYEKRVAYAKVTYYKAQYLISIGDWKGARAELKKVKGVNKIYKTLYILSFCRNAWKIAHKIKSKI
jgi:glycosyltransferase involved in cell wall biosynthesis